METLKNIVDMILEILKGMITADCFTSLYWFYIILLTVFIFVTLIKGVARQ